eukprot:COSAG04_NODE_16433_length_499_cov_0.902500_2_plen_73_part_01
MTCAAESIAQLRFLRLGAGNASPKQPRFRCAQVAQANDTPFGLASYFYSSDLSRVHRVSEALEYGPLNYRTAA